MQTGPVAGSSTILAQDHGQFVNELWSRHVHKWLGRISTLSGTWRRPMVYEASTERRLTIFRTGLPRARRPACLSASRATAAAAVAQSLQSTSVTALRVANVAA